MDSQRLAHYEIGELLGKGGMGEVYRARDTKLERDVALKLLPRDMSGDPERSARFAREAKTLASLQHANIASVYGYEEDGDTRFLVMELVEGEDLSARLDRGPIPVDEAIDIALQVATGLEAAHEQGIMHRDLKPANIKRNPLGDVKILDFGLARAWLGESNDNADLSYSPTITEAMTAAGTVLGTAAYMSPEQARGKHVDGRTDLWSFGVILYEMLTGARLFAGETLGDTLAAVLRADPDMDELPVETPPAVRRLLRRCLVRDPRQRLRSAGDARLELQEATEGAPAAELPAAAAARSSRTPWALALLLLVALGAVLAWPRGPTPEPPRVLYAEISLPPGYAVTVTTPALSPDGRWLAIVAADTLDVPRLFLRRLDQPQAQLVDVDDSVDMGRSSSLLASFHHLFWSPDSRYLGIQTSNSIHSLDVESGSIQRVLDGLAGARGAAFSTSGGVLFARHSNSPLYYRDEWGGEGRAVTTVDTTLADISHRWPQLLPDGERFVFTVWSNSLSEAERYGGIHIASIDGGEPRRLLPDNSMPLLDPRGYLLFHRDGKLMAVDFDVDAGEVTSPPWLVAPNASWDGNNGKVHATVSHRGDLLLAMPQLAPDHLLGWAPRSGGFEPAMDAPGLMFSLDLAPGERFASVGRLTVGTSMELWIADLTRQTLSRLSRFDSDSWEGRFSPDGRELAYTNQDPGFERVTAHAVDGATPARTLFELHSTNTTVTDWWGDLLFYAHVPRGERHSRLSVFDEASGESRDLLAGNHDVENAALSPDGRWLAYMSTESSRPEIYIRPFPALDRKWQISVGGGDIPHWHADGRELLYGYERSWYSVQLRFEGGELEPSTPQFVRSFERDDVYVVPNRTHERFLVGRTLRDPQAQPMRLVMGWDQRP